MRRFCCCLCLPVLGWLWRLICWAFGETGRKNIVLLSFSLRSLSSFLSFPSLCLRLRSWSTVPRFWLSGSGSISAALVGLGVCWRSCFRCCRRAGSGSSGVSLLGLISGAALPLVLSPCLFVRVRFCAGASSALVLSERVQAFPCPVLRLWWGLAGRRCRPKGCSIMHNSEMAYLYDMLMAYCTKRRCFWLAIFTFCQDII